MATLSAPRPLRVTADRAVLAATAGRRRGPAAGPAQRCLRHPARLAWRHPAAWLPLPLAEHDARGRGRSAAAAHYSRAADQADLTAVLDQPDPTHRPILVGWSNEVRPRGRHAPPGTRPTSPAWSLSTGHSRVSLLTDDDKARARRDFRRMGPLMRVMAAFGRSARMTPDQAADLTFELDEIAATLGADYDAVTAPVDFVVGSGRHAGQHRGAVPGDAGRGPAAGRVASHRQRVRDGPGQPHADPRPASRPGCRRRGRRRPAGRAGGVTSGPGSTTGPGER